MNNAHPLLRIAQDRKGSLVEASTASSELICATCLRPVTVGPQGLVSHIQVSDQEACTASVLVTVTKAMIHCLEDGQQIYVNPVRNGRKTLAPDLIFAQDASSVRPFVNTSYQPVGASWRSEKGYRLGLFFLPERAAGIKKDGFDFIAVINPAVFIAEFDAAWEHNADAGPLELLYRLLCRSNASSEWVKWPTKTRQPEKERYGSGSWAEYCTPEPACIATVTGIEGNGSGETIFVLQVVVNGSRSEYQIVRSLGSTLLLDNTGNAVSPENRLYALIRTACINSVKAYLRQNIRASAPRYNALQQ